MRAHTLDRGEVVGFREAQGGAVAVEFALVGGIIILLLLGILQAGLYFYTAAVLENAVAKATRQVMTGNVGSASMTADQFRSSVLCPLLPTGMPCANVITNFSTVSSAPAPNGFHQFVNATASGIVPPTMDNTKTGFCTGAAGSVVFAQVYYAMPIVFPLLFNSIADTWQGSPALFVGAFAAFRNEPFQNASNGGC